MSEHIVLIANADRRWAIGKENRLLYKVPEDMRHFREITTGNTVIYGRKTLDSFPGGNPLRDRLNIVISRSLPQEGTEGLLVARSPKEALLLAEESEKSERKDRTIYICGGESIYRQMLPFCDTAVITRVDAETPDADAFFPDLDRTDGWKISARTDLRTSVTGWKYRYVTYRRTGQ